MFIQNFSKKARSETYHPMTNIDDSFRDNALDISEETHLRPWDESMATLVTENIFSDSSESCTSLDVSESNEFDEENAEENSDEVCPLLFVIFICTWKNSFLSLDYL